MTRLRSLILFSNLLLFLLFINWSIWAAEQDVAAGHLAYFELNPINPVPLAEEGYFRLDYRLETQTLSDGVAGSGRHGQIVVQLDENQIAQYVRIYRGTELLQGEILVNYLSPIEDWLEIGIDGYLIEAGTAASHTNLRYAKVRILSDGSVMLIALCDANLQDQIVLFTGLL